MLQRTPAARNVVRRIAAQALTISGLAVFASFSIRAWDDGFVSADIGGITYNADLLLRGGLPYRDSLEYKSPASFFLVALVFNLAGRDLLAVHAVYVAWMLLGALAVWSAARLLYSREIAVQDGVRSNVTVAPYVAAAVYLISAGQFEYNYASWMTPPFVGAFAALLMGLLRKSRFAHVSTGFLAMLAYLFKNHAVCIALAFPALWYWARLRRLPGATIESAALWMLGAAICAVPLAIHYYQHGALAELAAGVFPLQAIHEYSVGNPAQVPWYELTRSVAAQMFRAFPLPAALALIGGVAAFLRNSHSGTPARPYELVFPQAVFLAASVLSAGIGGARFYSHYLIQYLPALALLAAHPAAIRFLGAAGATWPRRVAGWSAALALLLALFPQAHDILHGEPVGYLRGRAERRPLAARRAGEHIRRQTAPNETVFVWGLSALPVYFWADRFAPSPVYKHSGTVTTFNTNTAFVASGPIAFRPGPAAVALLAAFRERPPAYFVHSDYFEKINGPGRDPLDDFTALKAIIDEQYVFDTAFPGVRLYMRSDRRRPANSTH